MILDSSVVLLTGILWKFSLLSMLLFACHIQWKVEISCIVVVEWTYSLERSNCIPHTPQFSATALVVCLIFLINVCTIHRFQFQIRKSRNYLWVVWQSLFLLTPYRITARMINVYYRLFLFSRISFAVLFLCWSSIDPKCKAFLLQHNIVSHVVDELTEHLKNTVIVQICLLFLNVIGCDSKYPVKFIKE